MSANFEIHITTKDYLPYSMICNLLKPFGYLDLAPGVLIISDWDYSRARKQDVCDDILCESTVNCGEIVQFEGMVDKHCVGLRQYISEQVYFSEIWISTKYLPALDTNSLTSESLMYCKELVHELLDLHKAFPITLFAMGSEMIFEYSPLFNITVNHCHNAMLFGVNERGHIVLRDSHGNLLPES